MRIGKLEDGKTSSFTILEKAGLLRPMASSGSLLRFYGSLEQLKLVAVVAKAPPDAKIVINHIGFCPQGFSIDSFNRPHI